MQQLQRIGLWHLARQVEDRALRAALTPDFTLGCKRILFSNTYYRALQAHNAQVVARGVTRVTPRGVVGADGVEHPADTIVFGTGFHVADTSIPARVVGRCTGTEPALTMDSTFPFTSEDGGGI